jgi:hypothetical protein
MSFTTAEDLGHSIEHGLHDFLHPAVATAFNDESVRSPSTAPQSTFFYQIHGLVNHWWREWWLATSSQWVHMSQDLNHPMETDCDVSGLGYGVRLMVAGDFDNDGRDELAIAPAAPDSAGNDLWIMEFEPREGWRHMSQDVNHPMQTDCDISGLPFGTRSLVSGDFDGDNLAELAAVPHAQGSAGNHCWVVGFDTNSRGWSHQARNTEHPMDADFDCSLLDFPVGSTVAGDFDGDGRVEVALAPLARGSAGNDLWVMKMPRRRPHDRDRGPTLSGRIGEREPR